MEISNWYITPQFQRDPDDGRPNQHPHPEDLPEQQPTAKAAAHFRHDNHSSGIISVLVEMLVDVLKHKSI